MRKYGLLKFEEANVNLKSGVLDGRPRRFLLVRDWFYQDPDAVRQIARSMKFHEQSSTTGFMTDELYHERGIRPRLERVLGFRIIRWDEDPEEGNGIFYGGFSKGKHKEIPGVHADEPYDDITVVIYLTPDLPPSCGTSLWQHKSTGLLSAPTRVDAHRRGTTVAKLRERLERDLNDRKKWVEIDRVGYRYNRMVAYTSGTLHSASRHFGSNLAAGRIYQTFRVGVDWSSSLSRS